MPDDNQKHQGEPENQEGNDKKITPGNLITKFRSDFSGKLNRIRVLDDLSKINLNAFLKKNIFRNPPFPDFNKNMETQFDLESQISELRKRIKSRTIELTDALRIRNRDDELIARLRGDIEELQLKEKLKFLISRVNEDAVQKLFDSEDFIKLFHSQTECNAVVVSMDIRRSTELMLQARSPELYAEFITSLTTKLSDAVITEYGIFEKFTGDGVLCFFPEFYSGNDAMLLALKSAAACHAIFSDHYREYSGCFSTSLGDTGLGIGIDYGTIHMATINNELSIVGSPVVYACRFSSAPSGKTYLTEHAKAFTENKYGDAITLSIETIHIKHEENAAAYNLVLVPESLNPGIPDWDALIRQFSPSV
ncbi:MAG TPA: hypothetical protein PK253_15630 [Spirochaetota bacterium]|nr:hypothetical protein [Spirochaetota bacterium]